MFEADADYQSCFPRIFHPLACHAREHRYTNTSGPVVEKEASCGLVLGSNPNIMALNSNPKDSDRLQFVLSQSILLSEILFGRTICIVI